MEKATTEPLQTPARCGVCAKRLKGVEAIVGTCRCGGSFCTAHREAVGHACRHDYRADHRVCMERAGLCNVVVADKLVDRI